MTSEQFIRWRQILRKDQLTPLEKMQEAAFTELINIRSLEKQKIEEDERMREMLGRRELFKPDEKVFKFRQSIRNKNFLSEYVFPSVSHYPKTFNTKDTRTVDQESSANARDGGGAKSGSYLKQTTSSKKQSQTMCPITGLPALYRDPLTGIPYANKDAFKIIREKFFQKDEEKLFIRLQVMNDLLT